MVVCMKKIGVLKSKEEIELGKKYFDAFLFGIDGFSINLPIYFSLEELKPIIKNLVENKKEVFISLNKNMFHCDLKPLKNLVKELDTLPIAGIFYYDAALITLKQEGFFHLPLIWNQEHLVTNYATCNFYQSLGVKGAVLSSEITLDEILGIREKCNMKLMVPIFGYISMFTSKRDLVKNYLKTFSLKAEDTVYRLEKEGYSYPIINDERGTSVYSSHILNGLSEMLILKQNKIDYVLFHSFQIPSELFFQVLSIYDQVTEGNKEESEKKVGLLLNQKIDKGFLYKETIYRVKKYEK